MRWLSAFSLATVQRVIKNPFFVRSFGVASPPDYISTSSSADVTSCSPSISCATGGQAPRWVWLPYPRSKLICAVEIKPQFIFNNFEQFPRTEQQVVELFLMAQVLTQQVYRLCFKVYQAKLNSVTLVSSSSTSGCANTVSRCSVCVILQQRLQRHKMS